MLCGIGGRTIAEAKQRLSYVELRQWAAYRALRGSLNPGLRIEHGTAQLAALYANAHRKDGGYRLHDFAPYHDEPVITLEQAMESWS